MYNTEEDTVEPETITAQDVLNRLMTILTDLEIEPEAQGLTREEALQILALMEASSAKRLTNAMNEARRHGLTLDAIGQAVGTSRQAVWNRTSY